MKCRLRGATEETPDPSWASHTRDGKTGLWEELVWPCHELIKKQQHKDTSKFQREVRGSGEGGRGSAARLSQEEGHRQWKPRRDSSRSSGQAFWSPGHPCEAVWTLTQHLACARCTYTSV